MGYSRDFRLFWPYLWQDKKNTGKGKAPSSSMQRAVKKWKADTLQTVKKGKGKWKDSSSESEEASGSEDEEIEAMFAESSESEKEKWVQSIERRGFHCERGIKIDTFLFTPLSGLLFKSKIYSLLVKR